MATVYTRDELARVLRPRDIIAAIEEGFVALSDGKAVVPPVGQMEFEEPPGDCHIKYGYIRGDDTFTVKIATGFWRNPERGLPSSNGVVLVFSSRTGELRTILLDEGYLTDIRTAAAGAVAAKYLAPSKVEYIGIVGAGTQARVQLEFLKEVTPCRRVALWARSQERARAFEVDGFEIDVMGSVRELARVSQLILTTTPSPQWLLNAEDVQPGTHITAIGAAAKGRQELDPRLFALADVRVVDSRKQCVQFGDSSYAVDAGLIRAEDLVELGQIIQGGHPGRRNESQITIADLTGVAVQDIEIAALALKLLEPSTANTPVESLLDSTSPDHVFANWSWEPPPTWTRITAIDLHTGGEPLRVYTSGLPPIKGKTVLEKRRHFREHYDYIRRGTMWEPRGHADMYGAVITPSVDADFDAFFLHNEGYSTMCGHAIIALTTLVFETGLIRKEGDNPQLILNVPAGKVHARAVIRNGKVQEVSFRSVDSFLYLRDQHVEVPGLGCVSLDIAYGGAFYAFVKAEDLGLDLTAEHFSRLIDCGRRIKHAVSDRVPIKHPFEDDLSFLYGTIFTGRALDPGNHSRNVCIFADGELDRSATGSGVSARAALHYAKNELRLGEKITIESILGSTMTVKAVEETRFGSYSAVIAEVSGTASITGRNEFYFDPDDPYREGFILR